MTNGVQQPVGSYPMLNKIIEWFLWGLFMGMGWLVGTNLLNFIGSFMHR